VPHRDQESRRKKESKAKMSNGTRASKSRSKWRMKRRCGEGYYLGSGRSLKKTEKSQRKSTSACDTSIDRAYENAWQDFASENHVRNNLPNRTDGGGHARSRKTQQEKDAIGVRGNKVKVLERRVKGRKKHRTSNNFSGQRELESGRRKTRKNLDIDAQQLKNVR